MKEGTDKTVKSVYSGTKRGENLFTLLKDDAEKIIQKAERPRSLYDYAKLEAWQAANAAKEAAAQVANAAKNGVKIPVTDNKVVEQATAQVANAAKKHGTRGANLFNLMKPEAEQATAQVAEVGGKIKVS